MPLADKIRPTSIDQVVGQTHLLGEGRPLRKIITSNQIPNMIFYGPSGAVSYTHLFDFVATIQYSLWLSTAATKINHIVWTGN